MARPLASLESYFRLRERHTTVRREVLAGLTTFLAMSYILAVHPAILEQAGMDRRCSVTVTAIISCAATLGMGLYARRPFAVAPYMGENAFITFTVVSALGYPWEQALGAVFAGGVIFVLITVLGLRSWLAEAIPMSLKYSFVVGIGLFLVLVGLLTSGIVTSPRQGAPLEIGDFTRPRVALAFGGLLLLLLLQVWRVRGGIILAVAAVTAGAFLLGEQEIPQRLVSMPAIDKVFLKLRIWDVLAIDFLPVILAIFVLDFVDTLGTLLGVSARAGLLDEKGNLPEMDRPFLVDSLATVAGALLGTTTAGTFIESAAGVESGGRTGLTAVVTGLCFLPAIFLADLLSAVPACAYGPVLVLVGFLMIETVRHIDFAEDTEALPALATVAFMIFTYNIGHGITLGFLIYPLLKLARGRAREVRPGLWVLAGLSGLYYASLGVLRLSAGG